MAAARDVVSDWASSNFTTGNFFKSANLVVRATGATAVTANTWTDLTTTPGAMGPNFNNLIFMVWSESALGQNATLDVGLAQLERTAISSTFERRPKAFEFILCQRYYQKSFGDGVAPANGPNASNYADASNAHTVINGGAGAGINRPFAVSMRAAPTLTLYGNNEGKLFRAVSGSGPTAISQASINKGASASGLGIYETTTVFTWLQFHFTASAEL